MPDEPTAMKYEFFKGRYTYLTPSFERNPLTKGLETSSQETRVIGDSPGGDFMIIDCTVLTQYSSVTDRQTNRRPGHG